MLLLALWVPVSMHCALELLPGMHWLQCCCADDSENQTPSDCGQQSCGSLETGAVKVEERVVSVPLPPLCPLLPMLVLTADVLPLPGVETGQFNPVPPELTPRWRFAFRAARPPRAPSLVSRSVPVRPE